MFLIHKVRFILHKTLTLTQKEWPSDGNVLSQVIQSIGDTTYYGMQ
jgi:hypothetical protein